MICVGPLLIFRSRIGPKGRAGIRIIGKAPYCCVNLLVTLPCCFASAKSSSQGSSIREHGKFPGFRRVLRWNIAFGFPGAFNPSSYGYRDEGVSADKSVRRDDIWCRWYTLTLEREISRPSASTSALTANVVCH